MTSPYDALLLAASAVIVLVMAIVFSWFIVRVKQTIKEQIAGSPYADEVEIEIDADFDLNYEHVISAVSACTGEISESSDGSKPKISRFVEKIKFAPPRQSQRAAAGG